MRTLVILLSLALMFLTGIVIGMDRDMTASEPDLNEDAEQIEKKEVLVKEKPAASEPEMSDSAEHFTQKTAQFLESGVKGFYEMIVGITYDLVQVFF